MKRHSVFPEERAREIFNLYVSKYNQAEMLGEELEAQKSFEIQWATLQNRPEWVKYSNRKLASVLLQMDKINVNSKMAIIDWIQTSFRPSMIEKAKSFVETYVGDDPNFTKEDLQKAYEDLTKLGDIYNNLVNDYGYRSAMIALIWSITGDDSLVHALYSPSSGDLSDAYATLFDIGQAATND